MDVEREQTARRNSDLCQPFRFAAWSREKPLSWLAVLSRSLSTLRISNLAFRSPQAATENQHERQDQQKEPQHEQKRRQQQQQQSQLDKLKSKLSYKRQAKSSREPREINKRANWLIWIRSKVDRQAHARRWSQPDLRQYDTLEAREGRKGPINKSWLHEQTVCLRIRLYMTIELPETLEFNTDQRRSSRTRLNQQHLVQ